MTTTNGFTLSDLKRILLAGSGVSEGTDLEGDILDTSFDELGYDSIAMLETGSRIEREYGVTLEESILNDATTPRALVAAVAAHQLADPMRNDRLVALVTGATSGIGLAVARLLATQSYQVYIGARTQDNVSATVKLLQDEQLDVDGCAVDVRSGESVAGFVQAALDRFGPIDVLVNNAGISGGGVTAELTDELWDDVISTNLDGVFRMTREVLTTGGMRAKNRGRIINIASTAGKQGVVLGAPYSASKHGVVGFTKALGNELAPTGITVNAVCPGYVETPMAHRVRRNYARLYGTSEEAVLQKFQAKIPLGRYCTPEEVAGLVGYLASDPAAAITSQAMNVCGGLGNF